MGMAHAEQNPVPDQIPHRVRSAGGVINNSRSTCVAGPSAPNQAASGPITRSATNGAGRKCPAVNKKQPLKKRARVGVPSAAPPVAAGNINSDDGDEGSMCDCWSILTVDVEGLVGAREKKANCLGKKTALFIPLRNAVKRRPEQPFC